MKSVKLILSAINLWIFGIFLNLYNKVISKFLKKNSKLSKKHIVFAFKLYEYFVEQWNNQEKKHTTLILKYN